jgi:hypothetical protein
LLSYFSIKFISFNFSFFFILSHTKITHNDDYDYDDDEKHRKQFRSVNTRSQLSLPFLSWSMTSFIVSKRSSRCLPSSALCWHLLSSFSLSHILKLSMRIRKIISLNFSWNHEMWDEKLSLWGDNWWLFQLLLFHRIELWQSKCNKIIIYYRGEHQITHISMFVRDSWFWIMITLRWNKKWSINMKCESVRLIRMRN